MDETTKERGILAEIQDSSFAVVDTGNQAGRQVLCHEAQEAQHQIGCRQETAGYDDLAEACQEGAAE